MTAWFYVFYLQLHVAPFVGVFFYGVADVERLFCLDVACLRALSEGDTVHHVVRFVVYQLQLDVLLVSSYYLACTIVVHV